MTEQKNNQSGLRPEWKARQARKRVVNVIKLFLGVIFLGVVVGLAIVYKDQLVTLIDQFQKKETPQAPQAPKPAAPVPPPADKGPVASIPQPVVPPPIDQTAKAVPPAAVETVPGAEDEAARTLISSGKTALEQFNFDTAAGQFNEAAAKKCGAQLRAEAKTLASKAANFKIATKHIPISEYAAAETTYVIETTDGKEFCALQVGDEGDTIKVQQVPRDNPAILGKMIYPLPRSEIKKQTPVSKEEREKEFVALLGSLEASLGDSIQHSTDFYDLVYLSRRLNLGKYCITYLNRAYDGHPPDRQPDHFVGDTFRKLVVQRAIERASVMLSGGRSKTMVQFALNDLKRTLPDFQYATEECDAFKVKWLDTLRTDFKPALTLKSAPAATVATATPKTTAPPPQTAKQLAQTASEGDTIEFVVDDTVKGSGANATLVDKANAKYEEGMKFYRMFRQGSNSFNNTALQKALVLLDDAVELYGQALKKEPGNMSLSDRQTSASMIAYACRKYQTM